MKKILSILLCLALLGCAALAETSPAGEKLGFEMLKELYAEGNVLPEYHLNLQWLNKGMENYKKTDNK